MAFGFTRTLPTITGSHTDLSVLLVEGSFPTAAIDGGTNSIDNGGGNLRAYTDDGKGTQLSLEIVTFVTGGTPDIEVWVKIPTAATSNTIYLEADSVASSQPAFTASFGRNSVWSDYIGVYHCDNTSYTDSTGNADLTFSGTTAPAVVSTSEGNAYRFIQSNAGHLTRAVTAISGGPLTIQGVSVTTSVDGSVADFIASMTGTSGGQDISIGMLNGSGSRRIRGYTPTNLITHTDTLGGGGFTGQTVMASLTMDVSENMTISGSIDSVDTTPKDASISFATDLIKLGLGGRVDASPVFSTVDTVRAMFLDIERSQDFLDTERDNQQAPGSWGTSGTWADSVSGDDISPTGIASVEAFGTAVVTTGAVDIAPTSIGSAESFGTPVVTLTQTVTVTGIASEESFGTAVVSVGGVSITPNGIASSEAFGSPVVVLAGQVLAPSGIASVEAFGTAVLTTGAVTISVVGISSEESFGTATVAFPGAKAIQIEGQDSLIINQDLGSTTLYFNGKDYFSI